MTSKKTTTDRRAIDRREITDRRRGAEQRRATIAVGQNSLCLALTVQRGGGKEPLLVCQKLNWRREASSLLAPEGATELAVGLSRLTAQERMAGVETTIVLDHSLCVTRVANEAVGTIERLARDIEERSQYYLSLGVGKVSSAKKYYQLDARHSHALVSVVNDRTIDIVTDAMHTAGLSLKRVESGMVSVCRTHGTLHPNDDAPVLLVTLTEDKGFALAVARQGLLVFEYIPSGAPSPDEVGAVVAKHLSRFQRFCQRQQLDSAEPIKKVYLAGPEEKLLLAKRSLEESVDLSVAPLIQTGSIDGWETRGKEIDPSFAAALGGAVLVGQSEGVAEGPNLLERWLLESRKHLRPILIRSAAPLAAVLLVALSLLAWNTSLSARNGALAEEVAAAESVKTQHTKLRLELLSSEAKLNALRRLKQSTPKEDLRRAVTSIGCCLPADVWLERLTITDGDQAVLNGAGFSETGVYEFVKHMENLPGASSASLRETGVRSSTQGPTTSFSMTARFGQDGPTNTGKEASSE